MASVKASLKAINDAIRQQKWDAALTQAENLLARDPTIYQAHVFKAFALDKNNHPELAEEAYMTAVGIRSDAQAWQGLIKLYEKQGAKATQKYQLAALKLAEIFRDANEMYKCQDVVDKFIDFARSGGDRAQYVQALHLILPESPIYPALEGRVPHPSKTYETIAQILEVDEKKRINTLIGERRTRLGAKISEVTLEVNREVLSQSELGYIYEQLTLWSQDDDVRRQYEEKLLQFRYDRLLVIPPPDKPAELQVVQKLANDMVIIKHPFKLAWDLAIEWQDHKEIKDWDVNVLNEYCSFFPDSDLYRVLTGFMTSDLSPFPKKETEDLAPARTSDLDDESEDDEEGGAPTSVVPYTDEDRLLMMMEGISTTNSLLAHRLMGEYYQHLEEHESNVELMRKATKIMLAETEKTGKVFRNANQSFMLCLGTALVFYQSPRNHGEAKFLFDKALEEDPTSTAAMIGVGLIYEEEEEFDQAIEFLQRALKGDSNNLRVRAEVGWLYALKGDYTRGKAELESLLPSMIDMSVSRDLLAQTQYRLGCCAWNIDTSKSARKSRNGAYAYFLDALKSNISYAPAYGSLGIYYADYAKDKKRARKCFLKAVELSSAEVEAAERLARSFADDGDWDRVELVAQRVVDSGRVRPPPGSKKKGISWPLSALGVAELNKQDYAKAIVSFQQALRIAPEDYHSWVGLGESYHNSGRYIAATKAIQNARKLEERLDSNKLGDTWFTKYMLANVKRELSEFDAATDLYHEVISDRPLEEGVAIALMQTMVENASDCVEKGLFGRSVELATTALSFALTVPTTVTNTFNFWKAVGDSCSIFSSVQGHVHDFPAEDIGKLLDLATENKSESAYAVLEDVDRVGKEVILAQGIFPDDEQLGVDLTRSLHATILAHKRAIYLSVNDAHAQAVAYYNLGWAENRAHLCLSPKLRVKSSRYQKAAVRCFKRAIELEAGNPEFWNSLGVVTSEINPSVAQHAFVRSLYLNEKSAHVWSNLGTLALLQNDIQFANEAFTRAQSNDPDYAHAWLGQGFVALLYGDAKEARGLFTHAMDISDSSSRLTRRHYPTSLFDHVLTNPSNLSVTSLIQPLFALAQLRRLDLRDLAYQHLSTLYQERANDVSRAIDTLEKACEQLEASYEATESAESLARFALAKTDLARSYLSAGEYKKAAECGELALQLSSDESANELTAEQRRKARLSAHLTVGLAEYFSNNVDAAVSYFEAALDESNSNPDAVCVLAQVLWATGTDDARERARTVLFEAIESDPSHVQSILLLGIIALLDEDEESLDAVISELQTLRTSDKVTDADHSHIGEVFRAVAALSENSTEEDILTQLQNDVMLYPHLPHGWSRLAEHTGEEYPADMALNVALKAIPPRGELDAADLADAYAGTGKVADAQTAILMAPWNSGGWESLADVVSS